MPSPAASIDRPPPGAARPGLPLRMKVLLVTTQRRTGCWLAEAFAADGAAQIVLEEVVGVTAGLARLRDEVYDAILVSHDPGVLDAVGLVEALRGGGSDEPLIILGSQPAQELDAVCYEAGADDYCCVAETTVRGLLWKFARAIERFTLVRENRRLVQGERQRLQQEHREAERLLEQQRALICDLEELCDGASGGAWPRTAHGDADRRARAAHRASGAAEELPAELVDHYREMLRAYVIMGAGNLADEMSTLSDLLASANSSAQRTMQLHVHALEELVQGLGNRSARHVMNRADLLVLEVMGHLADGYRRRYHERVQPPRQQLLSGFELDGKGSVLRGAA